MCLCSFFSLVLSAQHSNCVFQSLYFTRRSCKDSTTLQHTHRWRLSTHNTKEESQVFLSNDQSPVWSYGTTVSSNWRSGLCCGNPECKVVESSKTTRKTQPRSVLKWSLFSCLTQCLALSTLHTSHRTAKTHLHKCGTCFCSDSHYDSWMVLWAPSLCKYSEVSSLHNRTTKVMQWTQSPTILMTSLQSHKTRLLLTQSNELISSQRLAVTQTHQQGRRVFHKQVTIFCYSEKWCLWVWTSLLPSLKVVSEVWTSLLLFVTFFLILVSVHCISLSQT